MGALPKTSFKSNFPIQESVPNCFLSEFKLLKIENNKGVVITFTCEGNSLSTIIKVPKKSDFKFNIEYKKEAERVKSLIESILYAYMGGSHMAEIMRECNNSFDTYVNLANKYLTETGAFTTPVLLKTIPNDRGEARLPRYPFVVKKEGDSRIKLAYSDYEKQLLRNNLN